MENGQRLNRRVNHDSFGIEPIQKIGVNPMTLKALVRERLENGQEVPSELFKPFEGNQTKITRRN